MGGKYCFATGHIIAITFHPLLFHYYIACLSFCVCSRPDSTPYSPSFICSLYNLWIPMFPDVPQALCMPEPDDACMYITSPFIPFIFFQPHITPRPWEVTHTVCYHPDSLMPLNLMLSSMPSVQGGGVLYAMVPFPLAYTCNWYFDVYLSRIPNRSHVVVIIQWSQGSIHYSNVQIVREQMGHILLVEEFQWGIDGLNRAPGRWPSVRVSAPFIGGE